MATYDIGIRTGAARRHCRSSALYGIAAVNGRILEIGVSNTTAVLLR